MPFETTPQSARDGKAVSQDFAAQTMSLEEVAAELGRPPAWLKRNWLRQHQEHGMPRFLPGSDFRWPAALTRAWLQGAVSTHDETKTLRDPVARARAQLHKEMGIAP